jgi:hypothetical protein
MCAVAGQRNVRMVAEDVPSSADWQYRDMRVDPKLFELALDVARA